MTGKIYVVVSVPLIEQEFDMYIPTVKKVGVVKQLIIRIVEEQSDFNFVDDGCKHLYDKITGDEISDNEFVRYSKIKNGSRLILY
ncbi:MAG: hypothetical protein HFI09_01680 [Bacilli bacterium]|nr:hypothetical protein [Bacilli bacterium]